MAFDHRSYNSTFLKAPKLITPDPKYGVRVVRANPAKGQTYWRVIGVHHLEPLENMSNRNIYMEVLDEKGNRLKDPIIWAGWTWEGIQGHQRADPTPLDKPDNETAGNISVGSNQKVSVWIKGPSRDANDASDRVEGLHTLHPDERLPDGRLFNSLGHHSFYVVFQRSDGTTKPPPPIPVEEPPDPTPIVGFTRFIKLHEDDQIEVKLMITVK